VLLGVRLSRSHVVCVCRVSLGGKGNVLYPIICSYSFEILKSEMFFEIQTVHSKSEQYFMTE